METPSAASSTDEAVGRGRVPAEIGLAVLAAVLVGLGVVGAVQSDAIQVSVRVQQAVAGSLAVAASLGAAGAARRSQRLTGWLLGLGLVLALVFSTLDEAPPVAAPPLLVALVLVLKPMMARGEESGAAASTGRVAVSVVSMALMLPIGLFYLAAGLIVPAYAASVAHVLYLVLLAWTTWHALRPSFWAAAGPVLAVMLWIGGAWAADYFFDWTA